MYPKAKIILFYNCAEVSSTHILFLYLNYINILLSILFRFFNSNLKTNSSEESNCSKKFAAREVTSYETLVTKYLNNV